MATDYLRWLLLFFSISAIASVVVWAVWGARNKVMLYLVLNNF